MTRPEYKKCRDMQIGDVIEGFYLCKYPSAKVTQNGKSFLSFKLADTSGEVEAIFWDYAGDLHITSVGKPIKVRGSLTEYNGKKQFTVSLIRAVKPDDKYNTEDLIPTAPVDLAQLYNRVFELIESMHDEEYKKLCKTILSRHTSGFGYAPAAKSIHHAFIGGLMMHTCYMMSHCDYLASYYPFLDRDLLLTGALCHDIGKLFEYDFTAMGLMNDLTIEGQLLGHPSIGARIVDETAKQIGMSHEKSILLQHMLLSHHGKLEYGAAVEPKTAEAMLLYLVDDLDSRMEIFGENLARQELGMSEQKIWPLGYKIYKHKISSVSDNPMGGEIIKEQETQTALNS